MAHKLSGSTVIKKRILIADRDSETASLIESRLVARGYAVTCVSTSEGVIRALEKDPSDLILLSARMEPVGGEELVTRIRKETLSYFVPVVMLANPEDLAKLIVGVNEGFDDFIIKPFDPLTLQLRVQMNIRRAEARVEANPLTKLPGNIAIERDIRKRMEEGELFSVAYLDINHFKSFNDRYGYDRGDDVIRQSARIIREALKKLDAEGRAFLGHVGGDDFIAVMAPDIEADFARECLQEFDRIIPTYYSQEEAKKGYIVVKSRKGRVERIPLMSIAVACVTNLYQKFRSTTEIAHVAAEVKSFLKTQAGSAYLRDRREHPMEGLDEAVEILTKRPEAAGKSKRHLEPLGKILLSAGVVNEEQLEEALKRHLDTGKRLGEVLVSMNLVRSLDVGKMLEKKLGVPYIPLAGREVERETSRLFTQDFVKAHRVFPIALKEGRLELAMIDPFDIRLIDDIERVTGFKVIPGLALEAEFEKFIERQYGREASEAFS